MSIDKYIKNIDSSKPVEDYLKSHINSKVVFSCMLLWQKDEPDRWAGPFKENYVGVTISKDNDLKSLNDIYKKHLRFSIINKFSFPYEVIKRSGINLICEVDGKKYERSELTSQEIQNLKASMSPIELIQYKLKIHRTMLNLNPLQETSLELPYKVRIFGNDDCSYSSVHKSYEDAINLVNFLDKYPYWTHVESQMFFTN